MWAVAVALPVLQTAAPQSRRSPTPAQQRSEAARTCAAAPRFGPALAHASAPPLDRAARAGRARNDDPRCSVGGLLQSCLRWRSALQDFSRAPALMRLRPRD